ncbi:LAETG motif-containing sortase-dependent surface protein [Streptomyces clavifer]|uniref:LAETG motif-containing sortase-dependent surface protein n=1 Tax=Streptomyces TaxID=1883 RepID=UPI001F5A7D00|nr:MULTISPECIES: LAETG motif-containing sortase-dependent surface protein [unclassified Streptomyces]
MALAAATAVIAPVVLLSAPAAFASGTPTPTDTTSATATPGETPGETAPAEETGSASPSATDSPEAPETTEPAEETPETTSPAPTGSETASVSPTPSASESEEEEEEEEEEEGDEELGECEPSPLNLSVNGLSGKIVRGSGWDTFTFNIYNNSKKTVKNVVFFAGASADKAGEELFSSKQVRLQALNEEEGTWEDLDELGTSSGYVGESDAIKPGYEVDIALRIKVQASAPLGAGFSLGGGLVFGEDFETLPCFSDVAYKFQIVDAGDDDGKKPQEGGKIPAPAEKPAHTTQLSGTLAETGSSSTTPMFALAGGAAVVLGAGAMFVVRRRNNGDAAA